MTESRHGHRAGLTTCAVTAALLLLTGCTGTPTPESGATSSAPTAQASSPADAIPTSTPAPTATSPTGAAAAPQQPPVLAAADPVSLNIPATGTESELLHLGLRDNGSLEVPPEGPGSPASWYTDSPTPGERGPAVLLGHVNATGGGPGVFADLRALKPGDTIEVTREDGSTAVFAVDRGEQYGKDDFPTLEVYGNTAGSELRLITCDGYDPATGEFDDNYVVYATLSP
ncbi:class F sortase [Kocuria rosea]|uniref:Class F sortase n=1 Tax=Kocuria rosea TaxID=1275 RepID=A0A4R5YN88_KOCRO|nr:class F sortase [Kocuria rosea]